MSPKPDTELEAALAAMREKARDQVVSLYKGRARNEAWWKEIKPEHIILLLK